MKYTVVDIEEDLDFGCEERDDDMPVQAVVTLSDETGKVCTEKFPDEHLVKEGIQIGDTVFIDEKCELKKTSRKNFSSSLERVIYMEETYERIKEALAAEDHPEERLRADLRELQEYYEGSDWLADFDAESDGAFPQELKRGILAEDTIYDLLTEVYDRGILVSGE